MTEMVERVSAAILAALEKSDPSAFIGEKRHGGFRTVDGVFDLSEVARAAIEAMREPTPVMIEAIDETVCEWQPMVETPAEAWRLGIDAALKSNVEVG